MNQQILFIGGPLNREFDEVQTPLPTTLTIGLTITRDRCEAAEYVLHYVLERRRQGDRRWPVYVHGDLPPTSEVLNLWYVRATFWQILPTTTGTGLTGH